MNNFIWILAFTLTVWGDDTLTEDKTRNKLFTASVYKEIIKTEPKNFVVSPLSAEIILALAQSGAKDETAQELQNALHLPQDQDHIKSIFKKLIPLLKGDGFSLHTANRVYLGKMYPVREEFKNVATDVFKSTIENVDFTKQAETSNAINNWVEKQTENKIQNLVTPDMITEDTVAFLINALYFKAKWVEQFESFSTEKKDFYKSGKDIIKVDTMRSVNFFTPFNFYENKNLKAKFLEIPFQGSGASMVFILPEEREGTGRLEGQIEDVLRPQPFESDFVDVALPKFQIETKIDFKKILQNLGVNLAFTRQADFRGIGGKKGNIYISDAFQKALIDVNEEGVEAAAATALKLVFESLPPQPTKTFIADHPFIYYIKVNDLILFIGKVVEPQYVSQKNEDPDSDQ